MKYLNIPNKALVGLNLILSNRFSDQEEKSATLLESIPVEQVECMNYI